MLIKKYIGFLAVVCVVLGISNQIQSSIPNQEIVLEFTNVKVTTTDTQTAISAVKQRLRELGAENIQVNENRLGELKIIYHSESDIALIKKALGDDSEIDLDKPSSNIPSDKDLSYNIHISEIGNSNDSDWNLEGTYVLEFKPSSQRFFVPITFLSVIDTDENNSSSKFGLAYKIQNNCALTINAPFYKIPEVRAGPLS